MPVEDGRADFEEACGRFVHAILLLFIIAHLDAVVTEIERAMVVRPVETVSVPRVARTTDHPLLVGYRKLCRILTKPIRRHLHAGQEIVLLIPKLLRQVAAGVTARNLDNIYAEGA